MAPDHCLREPFRPFSDPPEVFGTTVLEVISDLLVVHLRSLGSTVLEVLSDMNDLIIVTSGSCYINSRPTISIFIADSTSCVQTKTILNTLLHQQAQTTVKIAYTANLSTQPQVCKVHLGYWKGGTAAMLVYHYCPMRYA